MSSGTQWGISMTAAYIYTVAGNASGFDRPFGDGGVATAALMNDPTATAVDSDGRPLHHGLGQQPDPRGCASDPYRSGVQPAPPTTSTPWREARAGVRGPRVTGTGYVGTPGQPRGDRRRSIGGPLCWGHDQQLDPRSGGDLAVDLGAVAHPSGITVNQASGAEVTFIPPVSGACPAPYVGPGTAGTYCAPPYVTATLSYNAEPAPIP